MSDRNTIRAVLLRLDDSEHILLLTLHHIVSDGWSMGVLIQEMAALYEAFTSGRPSPLPEPVLQYADYAAWQRQWLQGEALESQLSYWKKQLEGAINWAPCADGPKCFLDDCEHTGAAFAPAIVCLRAEGAECSSDLIRLPCSCSKGSSATHHRQKQPPLLT